MTKHLIVKPNGWPCPLTDAPPGHIRGTGEHENCMWFKSEYHTAAGRIEAYNEAGEYLHIAPTDLVQPVVFEWEEM